MIEWVKVIWLGIVEGVTEFLPISSTGHLIIFSSLINFNPALSVTFDIFIQIGAVVAVVVVYREELLRQARVVRYDPGTRSLWGNLVIAVIPAGILAFALHEQVKAALFNPTVVALSLIVGGAVMIAVETYWVERQRIRTTALRAITWKQALAIGAAQVTALIPGVSRAAASIVGGLVSGLDRKTATEFSFLLAIPTLGGVAVAELVMSLNEIQGDDLAYLVVGAVVSGIVAWRAMKWLLAYVGSHNFVVFGVYRILAGLLILGLVALGVLPT